MDLERLDGRALAAFGAGVLCALILPRFLIGMLGASMVLVAGCLVSRAQHNAQKEC